MIIKYKKKWFTFYEEWFNESDEINVSKFSLSAVKKATKKRSALPFFIENREYTLVHDLTIDSEIQFNSFSRDTKSQIRRAEKLDVLYKVNDVSIDEFIELYNDLANIKKIPLMTKERIVKYNLEDLTFFSAHMDNELIIVHVYIHGDKICRPLYSSSIIHKIDDPMKRKNIGFINKLMHWKEMEYFKEHRYEIYDFGGYGNDKENKALAGVDRFKKSFNGSIKELYEYYSLPFYLLLWIKKVMA